MILADTNIWIDWLRDRPGVQPMETLLSDKQIVTHPWILAELALGHLGTKREAILQDLKALPSLAEYEIQELLNFVKEEKIYGKGLSLVDVHLFYAVLIEDCLVWTRDRQFHEIARSFGKAYLI